jgi:hypothetical protein
MFHFTVFCWLGEGVKLCIHYFFWTCPEEIKTSLFVRRPYFEELEFYTGVVSLGWNFRLMGITESK